MPASSIAAGGHLGPAERHRDRKARNRELLGTRRHEWQTVAGADHRDEPSLLHDHVDKGVRRGRRGVAIAARLDRERRGRQRNAGRHAPCGLARRLRGGIEIHVCDAARQFRCGSVLLHSTAIANLSAG